MAADVTIDDYLAALRRDLRGHHDRDATLDEVEDHLRSTAERLVAQGRASADAEAETVRSFGRSDAIAAALLAANGPAAVPTVFTQSIGNATLVGSIAWIVLAGGFWSSYLLEESGRDFEGLPRFAFMLGMAGLAASAVLTFLLALALRERQGGFGIVATIGIGFTALTVASSVVAWAVVLWTALFALGCLPIGVAALRHGAAPTRPMVAFAAAWPVGLATSAALHVTQFGGSDEWGNYPLANMISTTVGCAIMFVAFVGLGRWLRSEDPVDVPQASVTA